MAVPDWSSRVQHVASEIRMRATHSVQEHRTIVELVVPLLQALQEGLDHGDVVRIGLQSHMIVSKACSIAKTDVSAYDRDDQVRLLGQLLELVEVLN